MVIAAASSPKSDDSSVDLAVDDKVERFVSLCRARGLSVTPQRLAIYRSLVSTTSHPTPEALFAEVREQMPTLSLATVYKAIETFKELALVRELRVPDDHCMHLDGDVSQHHHLVCVRCRTVFDLRLDAAASFTIPDDSLEGFRVLGCSVQFEGVCAACDEV